MYDMFVKLLQNSDLTAYKFSKETGISQTTLSEWKSGKIVPKIEIIKRIATYFDVTIDYLLGNEQKKSPADTAEDEKMKSIKELYVSNPTFRKILDDLSETFHSK